MANPLLMRTAAVVLLAALLASLAGAQKVCPGASWWRPSPRTSWQWQLSGTLDTSLNVRMYDIDLENTPKETIAKLHAQGRVVVCYYSAGSAEKFRSDYAQFPASALGNALDGWPDERWVDFRVQAVRDVMGKRLDLAVAKGCDGVEPDNVDAFANKHGIKGLTEADQIAYNKWTAAEAHRRGLSVGLKNALDVIPQLVKYYDWALNEECVEYDECDKMEPFVRAGKAVFGALYKGKAASVCKGPNGLNYDFLVKKLELGKYVVPCRSYSAADNKYSCVKPATRLVPGDNSTESADGNSSTADSVAETVDTHEYQDTPDSAALTLSAALGTAVAALLVALL
eukprot:m51a1_g8361 putative endo alpha- polygalactosaminidase (341) ;mRNA; f:92915-94059